MIILDITAAHSMSSLNYVPMAWLKGTDPQSIETIAAFQIKGQNTGKVRLDRVVQYSDDQPTLSNEERSAVWYTRKEILAMRTDSREEIRDKKITQDTDDFSIRGLEDYVSARATKEKKSRKHAVIQGVLDEQERQLELGAPRDWDKLRRKSVSASRDSGKIALRLAVQDAEEARGEVKSSGIWSRNAPEPRVIARTSSSDVCFSQLDVPSFLHESNETLTIPCVPTVPDVSVVNEKCDMSFLRQGEGIRMGCLSPQGMTKGKVAPNSPLRRKRGLPDKPPLSPRMIVPIKPPTKPIAAAEPSVQA